MNPPLLLCSIFILLVLLLMSTDIPSSVYADGSDQYFNCSANFSCGIVNNVGYPFWGDNRAEYCGQPGFQLDCQDSTPKLIVNSVTYRILKFNFSDQSLQVVRDDYWKNLCPSQYLNGSFGSTPFDYADGFQNIALLYDCPNSFNTFGQFFTSSSAQCPSSSGTKQNVYYGNVSFSTDLTGVCKVVLVPIMDAYVAEVFIFRQKDIEDAIDDGFGLRWSVDDEECNNCVNSGGQCGYNQKFTCFCNNGRQGTTCSGMYVNCL